MSKSKFVASALFLLSVMFLSCEDNQLEELDFSHGESAFAFPDSASMHLLSGTEAYLLAGDTAHVTIRTYPWFLPQYLDTNLVVTDTLGYDTGECTITGKTMLPDSTWRIDMVPDNASSIWVRICSKSADFICNSAPINIKTVTLPSLPSSISICGELISIKESQIDYSMVMPTITDFSNLKMVFLLYSNWDSVTVDGEKWLPKKKSYNDSADFRKPVDVSFWKYGLKKSLYFNIINTGLPVVRISTPKSKDIVSKEDWMSGCTITIELSDGSVDLPVQTLSIRGRGNASWRDTDKKSYALRFDEKSKVLGMHKNKRWILLANFKDRTLLRNDVTFWLARQTSQDYVVNGCFVELELNGKYRGNYYLCEQGKISKNRININDPDTENPGTGGFLLESDAYYSDERNNGQIGDLGGFISKNMQLPYAFKQPDEEEMTQAALEKVEDFINKFEYSVMHAWTGEYRKYLDIDQCIDYAIIQELTGNQDFYNNYPVNGPHSMYFHVDNIDNGGKLVFGHLWDFDYLTYDPQRVNGWTGLDKHGSGHEFYYWHLLSKDNTFRKRFIERWNQLKKGFEGAPDYIEQMSRVLELSEYCNAHYPANNKNGKGWIPIENKNNGGANSDQSKSYRESIEMMKDSFRKRLQWMDDEINQRHYNIFFPQVKQ